MAAKKRVVKKAGGTSKAPAKKVAKKAARKAQTFLGRIVQRSAQLILASGVLGEPPQAKRPSKKTSKARQSAKVD